MNSMMFDSTPAETVFWNKFDIAVTSFNLNISNTSKSSSVVSALVGDGRYSIMISV